MFILIASSLEIGSIEYILSLVCYVTLYTSSSESKLIDDEQCLIEAHATARTTHRIFAYVSVSASKL